MWKFENLIPQKAGENERPPKYSKEFISIFSYSHIPLLSDIALISTFSNFQIFKLLKPLSSIFSIVFIVSAVSCTTMRMPRAALKTMRCRCLFMLFSVP